MGNSLGWSQSSCKDWRVERTYQLFQGDINVDEGLTQADKNALDHGEKDTKSGSPIYVSRGT